MDCHARGKVGAGNIGVHIQKQRRDICHECGQTLAETKGTPFDRLKKAQDLVTLVVTLLANGCPVQAIVVAFGLDERTVRDWLKRSGTQGEAVHEHLVQQPREVGQVHADPIRVHAQGSILWMAMAVMVPARLWVGGVISVHRDGALVTALMEKVRACASAFRQAILFCTDGFGGDVTAIGEVFRQAIPSHHPGRPRPRAPSPTSVSPKR